MRINDYVRQYLALTSILAAPPKLVPSEVLGIGGGPSGQPNNPGRQFLKASAAEGNSSESSGVVTNVVRGSDQVDLGNGQLAGAKPGQAYLDQFIRRRAQVSFSIPGGPNGTTTNFTYEVESAYRLITPVPAGYLLDAEG